MSHEISHYYADPIEYVQDMQLWLTNYSGANKLELGQQVIDMVDDQARTLREENARYLFDTRSAVVYPNQDDYEQIDGKTKLIWFADLAIEGSFREFRYLKVDTRIVSGSWIDTLCVLLSDVQFLPGREWMPEADDLYMPVLAIANKIRIPGLV